jgi:carbonic anhydrase
MSQVPSLVKRRYLLKLAAGMMGSISFLTGAATGGEQQTKHNSISSEQALKLLLDGNQRFVRRKSIHPHQSRERMDSIAQMQRPFAAILSCADSRVPAEIIFDCGLGDLFVVRVAGNVACESAIGSLEYATAVLGCQIILVLGHQRCGAVIQALQEQPISGRMSLIVENIKPAVDIFKCASTSKNLVDGAVIANIKYQVQKLSESSTILTRLSRQGQLKIIGARYDLDTGIVSIIS